MISDNFLQHDAQNILNPGFQKETVVLKLNVKEISEVNIHDSTLLLVNVKRAVDGENESLRNCSLK